MKMKKDLIFAPIMLAVGILLFLFEATGTMVHIAVAVIGIFALAIYTAATKKEWKIPALEILTRVFYGVALLTGPVVLKLDDMMALQIAHKASAALFVVLLLVVFVHKLIVNQKANH
jgi:drug/metabolite transporter (DMT)-like permease